MADNEYIKRSMVVEIIEEEIRRQNSVSEVLTCAHLRTAVMGLPTADVAPRAEVAREIFEEIQKMLDRCWLMDDYGMTDMMIDVAELKKKYTEADHDNQ